MEEPGRLLSMGSHRVGQQQQHADDITLMAGIKEESKSLLMKVKEESKKAG